MTTSNCKQFPLADEWCLVCGDQEYKLPSGETITLSRSSEGNLYYVDCWDKDNESRWHKEYAKLSNAMAEYLRWQ